MKIYNLKNNLLLRVFFLVLICLSILSCDDDFLKEKPVAKLSGENVLTSVDGFESAIAAIHFSARDELAGEDLRRYFYMFTGTDIVTVGQLGEKHFRNYETYLTPYTDAATRTWNWAYTTVISQANFVISYAEKEGLNDIWKDEAQKNAIIAEAKFFRAYGHNILANLYGGVPIADEYYSSPKTDFIRSSREDVYSFIAKDLEFASQWLPETVSEEKEGRMVKAAADHLLAEVYISLGEYDKAINSANNVINSGLYHLMTERFGANKDKSGDVFSDLFIEGNMNRSSGNMESIWVWQYDEYALGGSSTVGGNQMVRAWLPFLVQLRDPAGKLGMSLNIDTLGRGVGICRPTTFFLYDLWKGNWDNDMRNSKYNIKRDFWYSNPASDYFGQKVEPRTTDLDTLQRIYPYIRKVEGKSVSR